MNTEFWNKMAERIIEDIIKMLPDRADERNMNRVSSNEYLDSTEAVRGWNACLDEIKLRFKSK